MPTVTPKNVLAVATECDVSYRQVHHWAKKGYLGPDFVGRGTGTFIPWDRLTVPMVNACKVVAAYESVRNPTTPTTTDTYRLMQHVMAGGALIHKGVRFSVANKKGKTTP